MPILPIVAWLAGGFVVLGGVSELATTTAYEIPAGHAGYVAARPWLNPLPSSRGYLRTELGPYRVSVQRQSVTVQLVDLRAQTFTEEVEINTADQLRIPFRVHAIIRPNAPAQIATAQDQTLLQNTIRAIVEQYSVDWYVRTVKEPFRTVIREAVGARPYQELNDRRNEITQEIERKMREFVANKPFVIESISVGNFNFPARITQAIEEKLAAEQRLQQQAIELQIANQQIQIQEQLARAQTTAEREMREALTDPYLNYLFIRALTEVGRQPGNLMIMIPTGADGMSFAGARAAQQLHRGAATLPTVPGSPAAAQAPATGIQSTR